jgi:hypothetical protein
MRKGILILAGLSSLIIMHNGSSIKPQLQPTIDHTAADLMRILIVKICL